MRKDKLILSKECRNKLRELRKSKKISAEDLSVKFGYSKAWLGKIESGTQQTIKQTDLIGLLDFYLDDSTPDEIISSGIFDNFIKYAMIFPSRHEYIAEWQHRDIPTLLFKCIDCAASVEQEKQYYNDIQLLLDCFEKYPAAMTDILSNMKTLHKILECYYSLDIDQNINNLKRLSSTLEKECKEAESKVQRYLIDNSNEKENG